MKFFVTGVNGQLGHDVMNELSSRSYEGIGSDIAPKYSGIQDDSPVTKMPYISLDITDKEAVTRILKETAPDIVVHCAAWTAVDLARRRRQAGNSTKNQCRWHTVYRFCL